jgi:superoxide reductase
VGGKIMKTFVCQVCRHIAFDQAPVDCPVCDSPIENFENEPDAIQQPSNPDNLTEMDRKHIPLILIKRPCALNHNGDCVSVQVSVGDIEHVMESEHFIQFIDYYINRKYTSRVTFTPKRTHPASDIHLDVAKGTISVIANCNVHGNWRAKVKLDEE